MKMNNYDQTKKMLNTIRNLNESKVATNKIIKEEAGQFDSPPNNAGSNAAQQPVEFGSNKETVASEKRADDITNINDVDVHYENGKDLDDAQQNAISQLIDNFSSQVSQLADYDPGFTITPDQIRLDGKIPFEGDNNVIFTLIAGKDEGFYMNANMLAVDNNVMEAITNLLKFNTGTFKTAMQDLLNKRKAMI